MNKPQLYELSTEEVVRAQKFAVKSITGTLSKALSGIRVEDCNEPLSGTLLSAMRASVVLQQAYVWACAARTEAYVSQDEPLMLMHGRPRPAGRMMTRVCTVPVSRLNNLAVYYDRGAYDSLRWRKT